MALRLEAKVAMVTGSSLGIGKNAIALHRARGGAGVAVCARSKAPSGDLPGTIGQTAAQFEALGRQALAVRMERDPPSGMDLSRAGSMDLTGKTVAFIAATPWRLPAV